MKKYSFFILIFLMISAFIFSACSGADTSAQATDTNTSEELIDGAAEETSYPTEAYPSINGRFNEKGMLKLISGDETIIPYEHDIIGQELNSWGGLGAEGLPLGVYLPEIHDLLPVVDRAKGFELEVYEWGTIYLIDIFDTSFNTVAHRTRTKEMYELIAATDEELIIDMQIYVPGCEEFDEPTECTGTGYAFIVRGSNTQADGPFVRLYSDGTEVGTKEFFFYSYTAHYYDGAPVGMLHADGEAFFDPNHIAEAYDSLPVYEGSRGEGLDIRLTEGAEIRQIYIYDPANGFLRTSVADKAALDRFIEDTAAEGREYAVEIVICLQGDYIEDLGEYEYEANGYAFIVK